MLWLLWERVRVFFEGWVVITAIGRLVNIPQSGNLSVAIKSTNPTFVFTPAGVTLPINALTRRVAPSGAMPISTFLIIYR